MIIRRTVWRIPLAKRSTRRNLLVAFWIVVAAATILTGLGADNRLHWFPDTSIGAAEGLGGGLLVYMMTILAIGHVVDFEGKDPRARTPFQLVNGFIDGALLVGDSTPARIDERDAIIRNKAHFSAFRIMRSFALWGVLIFNIPSMLQHHPWLSAPIAFLMFMILMYLPQTLVLWTEPDMEAE